VTTIPQHHRQTDRTACTLLRQFSQGRQKFNTSIHSDNENLLLGTSVCHQKHYTFCLLVYECSRETRKLLTTYFKFLTNYNILFAMFDIAKRCKNKYRIAKLNSIKTERSHSFIVTPSDHLHPASNTSVLYSFSSVFIFILVSANTVHLLIITFYKARGRRTSKVVDEM